MASATFEVATLSDAITKASSFSPSKGSLLDRCGGVVITINPNLMSAEVRSTDLESSYRHALRLLGVEADETSSWRISDKILEPVLRSIPAAPGSTISILDSGPGRIGMDATGFSEGTSLMLFGSADSFPAVDAFDPANLSEVENFGAKLDRVAWAASRRTDILSGIHLDGSFAWAMDGTTAARIDMELSLPGPVTVPFTNALGLLKAYPSLKVGADANALLVQVDSDIQVTLGLMSGDYPDLTQFIDSPRFDKHVNIPRLPLIELANRLTAPFSDRKVRATLSIEGRALSLVVEEPEIGRLGGSVDLPTDAPSIEMLVTILDIRTILTNATGTEVTFSYIGPLGPIRFMDNAGFAAVTMPRKA